MGYTLIIFFGEVIRTNGVTLGLLGVRPTLINTEPIAVPSQ